MQLSRGYAIWHANAHIHTHSHTHTHTRARTHTPPHPHPHTHQAEDKVDANSTYQPPADFAAGAAEDERVKSRAGAFAAAAGAFIGSLWGAEEEGASGDGVWGDVAGSDLGKHSHEDPAGAVKWEALVIEVRWLNLK